MTIFRWDLDKSYIETDFESLRGLIRAATESSSQKKTVPGAASLLRHISSLPDSQISVLSGSPEQLRSKILERFQLDNISVDSLHLKDSIERIKKGRFRDIKGQFGFKLSSLLTSRSNWTPTQTEFCFGDDVEADALIYLIYSKCLTKELDQGQLFQLMKVAGAYEDHISHAIRATQEMKKCSGVDCVFIRVTHRRSVKELSGLSKRVIPVHSWSQAAFVLHDLGQINKKGVKQVLEEAFEWTPSIIANLIQDMNRQGYLSSNYIEEWPEARPYYLFHPKPPPPQIKIDFAGLLKAIANWTH